MNMKEWVKQQIQKQRKIPLPVLSFPVIQLMGVGIKEFIRSSELQAEGMLRIIQEVDMPAAISLMDLSVEAEAFGAEIKFFDKEIPAVLGKIIHDEIEAEELRIPLVGTCRTSVNLKAVELVKEKVTDRPVFAGTIGPFSLAGRLMGVSDAVVCVRRKPEMVKILLEKATQYLVDYINAYKKIGADGVLIAEPLAGLLAPKLAQQYSHIYMKKIIQKVQSEEFMVIYHNCGGSAAHMVDSVVELGAMGYHFGNAIDLSEVMPHIPSDRLVMGNVDPAGVVKNGTPETVYENTLELLEKNAGYPNYLLSTGCDIPPATSWDNIRSFFKAAEDFYKG